MQINEAISKRRSIRKFTGELPDEENLKAIIKAGEQAPVAMGKYGSFHMTILTNKDLLNKINEKAAAFFKNPKFNPLYDAPMLIIISAEKPAPGLENSIYSSAACIVENMALEAVEQDVGACLIWGAIASIANDQDILQALNIPEGSIPCCGIVLGKSDMPYKERSITLDRIQINEVK